MPTGDNNIRRGQRIAAKDQAFRGQAMTDRLRAQGLAISADQAAAAEADRLNVRHAEIGPDATHLDHRIGFAREATLQHTNVRRGAANINDNGILQPGQQHGAAQGIGRP